MGPSTHRSPLDNTDTSEFSLLHDSDSLAAEALIRRVLCPTTHSTLSDKQTPLEKLLPPLTSSNAVDLQLYAILAVVMRDFVYSWYGKITLDQKFVAETIQVVAHCTRELEQRLRRLDLELLLLHDIPDIIKLHIEAFRIAYSRTNTPGASEPEILYHALCPHAALSPAPEHGLSTVEQIKNEAAYRQLLVQGVLAVLLPTEDLQNPCLCILVADVIADLILGNAIGAKASSGWMIWEGIAKVLEPFAAAGNAPPSKQKEDTTAIHRLEKFGLVSVDKSDMAAARVPGEGKATFWRILQYIYLAILGIRFLVVGLWAAASSRQAVEKRRLQQQQVHAAADENGSPTQAPIAGPLQALSYEASNKRPPFLTYSAFDLLSQLLEIHKRMPWLAGGLSLIRHHLVDGGVLQAGCTGGVLDRFLHNTFQQRVLRPDLLPSILQALRHAIFPNNALGASRAVPPMHEQRLIKRRAAIAILNTLPASISSHYLSSPRDLNNESDSAKSQTQTHPAPTTSSLEANNTRGKQSREPTEVSKSELAAATSLYDFRIPDQSQLRDAQLRDIESVLDLFGNQYMNKHMLYSVVELLVVRLVPELQTRSVRALLDERLGPVQA